jgi:hypothetical protein
MIKSLGQREQGHKALGERVIAGNLREGGRDEGKSKPRCALPVWRRRNRRLEQSPCRRRLLLRRLPGRVRTPRCSRQFGAFGRRRWRHRIYGVPPRPHRLHARRGEPSVDEADRARPRRPGGWSPAAAQRQCMWVSTTSARGCRPSAPVSAPMRLRWKCGSAPGSDGPNTRLKTACPSTPAIRLR